MSQSAQLWQPSPVDPPAGVGYSQVLRTPGSSPIRSLIGVLMAVSMYLLVVPVVSRTLILLFWVLRGRPDQAEYVRSADAYEVPEGLVAGHIALAMLIPIAFLVSRCLHSMAPRWMLSVQPGLRFRYLTGALLIAVVVLNGLTWLSVAGDMKFIGPQQDWVWFALAIVVFSPIQAAAEEVFFRGYLFQAIGSLSAAPWLAVGMSALLFAAFHGMQNPALFADRFFFGLLAGFLVVLTGGIEAGIAAHIVNNISAFGYALFSGGVARTKGVQQISWLEAGWDVARFGVFAACALWLSRRMKLATTTP